jgi:uncharacterized protein YndB with AHSA1/START domain
MDARSDSMGPRAGALTVAARGDLEIVMTRVFNAPRKLVWEAMTTPSLVRRWLLGPEGWTMPVCEIDLRVGGAYRYVWSHPSRGEMGMGGVYREIVPPERIVCTERFDQPWYPGVVIDTSMLTERDGRTTLTLTILADTRETRDAILKSGMEGGIAVSYDRLDEVLATAGMES